MNSLFRPFLQRQIDNAFRSFRFFVCLTDWVYDWLQEYSPIVQFIFMDVCFIRFDVDFALNNSQAKLMVNWWSSDIQGFLKLSKKPT